MAEKKVEEKPKEKKVEPPTGKLPDGVIAEVRTKNQNIFNCTHVLYIRDLNQYYLTNEEGEHIELPYENVEFVYFHKVGQAPA